MTEGTSFQKYQLKKNIYLQDYHRARFVSVRAIIVIKDKNMTFQLDNDPYFLKLILVETENLEKYKT